jgi:hypothetical protein
MGTCYSVILEHQAEGETRWSADALFEVGKSHELARCFPHAHWPKADDPDDRSHFTGDDGDLPYGGCFWGTYEEVLARYEREIADPGARDFPICRGLLAAAKVLRGSGPVRLLIWGDG